MKSLIVLLLLIVCISFSADAFMLIGGRPPVSGTCSTPSNGDELDEGFLGVGYENTWTESGTTIDEDFTLSGSPPSGSCSEGLNINTSESNAYTYWDRGSAFARGGNLDIVCEVYLDSAVIDSANQYNMITWDDNTLPGAEGVAAIAIRNSAGVYKWKAQGAVDSATIDVAIDIWTTLTLHMDATAANSYFNCSGCTDETNQLFTRHDTVDGRYLHLGTNAGIGAGESFDIEWGYCYVNSP